ncbi:MAG: YciI family protein [Saprospiraceae bacterium]
MHYRLLLSLSIILSSHALSAQSEPASEIQYDSTYAARLGADDYGMKPYVMAFLKAGPERSQDAETAAALQKAHLKNIMRMAEEGTLVLAGPFLDQGEVRGIYIFNVATVAEAEALTNTDPAIQAGRLVMELHPWYGSAALMEVNRINKNIQKKPIN